MKRYAVIFEDSAQADVRKSYDWVIGERPLLRTGDNRMFLVDLGNHALGLRHRILR